MLRAGTAATDITPPADVDLLGYDFRQERLPPGNAGARDALHARALMLSAGDERALLVTLDLCVLSVALARRLRTAAATAAGVAAERVVLACSHTHSGPVLHDPEVADGLQAALPNASTAASTSSARYTATLPVRIAEVAARAAGLTVPVSAGALEAPLALAYDRRVMTAAGLRPCWNPQEQADLAPRPTADPTCTVLALRQLNGPRQTVLASLGAHPVVLGKTSRVVSADWPGEACRIAEGHLGAHASVLFALGACGDTQPWIATQEDHLAVRTVGATAGGFVALLTQAAPPRLDAALRLASRTVALGGHELDLAAWRIGEALLLAAPVELFAGLAVELRRALPGPLLLCTNANGWTGYWPTRAAFAQGGYEVDAARAWGRQEGDGERLIAALVELARSV